MWTRLFLALCLISCNDKSDGGSDSAAGDDTAPTAAGDIEVSLNADIQTVVEVQWGSPDPANSRVEVTGSHGGSGTILPAADGTTAGVVLAPPETELTLRVVTGDDEGAPATITTGALPPYMPATEIRVREPGAEIESAVVLFGTEIDDGATTMLVDAAGEVLWYVPRLGDTDVPSSCDLSLDGRGFWMSAYSSLSHDEGVSAMEDNEIRLYGWDGQILETIAAPRGHHLIQEVAPNEIAWIGLAPEVVDGFAVDILFDEIILSQTDGTSEVLFTTREEPWSERCGNSSFYPGSCEAHHVNSVYCDMEAGNCTIVIHAFDRIVRFDIATGEIDRDYDNWEAMDSSGERLGKPFDRPHDVNIASNGDILFLNDGAEDGGWASRFSHDDAEKTLTETWTWGRDECIYTTAHGGFEALPGGNYFMDFGIPSTSMREVAADGTVMWDLRCTDLENQNDCDSERKPDNTLHQAVWIGLDELPPQVAALVTPAP